MTIPITFEYKGKRITGEFSKVSGAGMDGGLWHFMVNDFYRGTLTYYPERGWRFTSQTGEMEELSEFFGDYVTAWIG